MKFFIALLLSVMVCAVQPTAKAVKVRALQGTTTARIRLLQVFDYTMSAEQATAAAPRYDVIWGSGIGNKGATARSWQTGNPRLLNARYFVQESDNKPISGHDLPWWQSNHPTWILYDCDTEDRPTHTVAYQPKLNEDVPLDITNPAVIEYQIHSVGNYAIAHGYNAIAADQILFFNNMGNQLPGYFGCGTYDSNDNFVRRYRKNPSGHTFPNRDPQWKHDTAAWVVSARRFLRSDPVLSMHHLKLIVNHPAGKLDDPDERTILGNVDATLDETGFSSYGAYQRAPSLFKTTLDYMEYAQAHRVGMLIIDKFAAPDAVTPLELEYSIATYLLGNEGKAYLMVSPSNGYGSEQYHPEYATNVGRPCGKYYGGSGYDAQNPHLYYRKFSNAIVVVNSGSFTRPSELAHLSAGKTYADLGGRPVALPLTVNSADAYVLLTSNGCSP